MKDYDFSIGILVGAIFIGALTYWINNELWRSDTIERDLAIYCPTSGDWAWKGECVP